MINNSRTANGTDGQAYMEIMATGFAVRKLFPAIMVILIPRYVRDVRLGTRVVQTCKRRDV